MKTTINASPLKQYDFGTLREGDCERTDGLLIFNADGTGHWSCKVKTYHTHSGDTWHIVFWIQSQAHKHLLSLGTWDGPRHMNDDGTVYSWERDFTFPADKFAAIYEVLSMESC